MIMLTPINQMWRSRIMDVMSKWMPNNDGTMILQCERNKGTRIHGLRGTRIHGLRASHLTDILNDAGHQR